jgi:hypothetical protein
MSRWGNDPPPLDDVGLEEEDELSEGQWELDPNDPTHPDHDLSVAHGYSNWEPAPITLLARRNVVVGLCILVVIALIVPLFWYVF